MKKDTKSGFPSLYNLWLVVVMSAFGAGIFEGRARAALEEQTYVVVRVMGEVLTREPLAAHWVPVKKGMHIKHGQLIQTTQGSSIALEAKSSQDVNRVDTENDGTTQGKSISKRKSMLKISTPMIVRMQSNLYRKVKVSRYFIEDVPSMASRYRPKSGPIAALENAWNKVSLDVKGSSKKKSSLLTLSTDNDDDVDLTNNAQKIEFLSPPAGALMRAGKLPIEVQVAWKRPNANIRSYVLYLWQKDRERPPPVSQTKLDRDIVLIPSFGEYFVQVASEDGVWQTEPHVLRVVPIDTKSVASSSITQSGHVGSIQAMYPPPSLTLFGSRGAVTGEGKSEGSDLLFQWRLDGPVDAREFELVIVDTNGKEINRSRVKNTRSNQRLPPGEYSWWVEANAAPRMGSVQDSTSLGIGSRPESTVKLIRSESRQLSISSSSGPTERSGWLKAIMSRKKQETIYLSDGL